MSSKEALTVVFEGGERQETLVYTGETFVTPCELNAVLSDTTLKKQSSKCQLRYHPITYTYELSGTPMQFAATPISDPLVKNGITTTIQGRLQTISLMDIYSHKSIEELRLEDYMNSNRGNGKVVLTYTPCMGLRGLHHQLSSSSTTPPPSLLPSPSLNNSACSSSAELIGSSLTPDSSTTIIPANSSTEISEALPSTASHAIFTTTVNSEPIPKAPLSVTSFPFTPNINFISESDPACVFTAPQPPAAVNEPLSSLSVSEGQQLRDALLENIVKCMQIQNSLYRLVLLKLQACVTGLTDAESQHSEALNSATAPSTGSAGENLLNVAKKIDSYFQHDSLSDSPKALSTESTGLCLNAISGVNHTVNAKKSWNDASKVSSKENTLDSKEIDLADASKASNKDNVGEGKSSSDIPISLLCELKEPINALMHCADIQRLLFQRLIKMNVMTTEETSDSSVKRSSLSENQELYINGEVDMLTVQSKLEAVTFKTKKMECNYAQNPFTSQQLKPSTSKDILQHISVDKVPSNLEPDGGACSGRELPHGLGTLRTATGEFIYSGDWYKGKRHGKGEGLILPFPVVSTEHGFYIGGWKHNMRHGNGKMMFSSGAVYEGQWQYDKMTGYGTLKLPDGTIQEGTWKEGSLQGCVLFTWPHGVTEYREYDANQGQVSSCKLEEDSAEKLSQLSCIRSQLLNVRDFLTDLKDEKLSLEEQVNRLKTEYTEIVRKLHTFVFEIHQNYAKQWDRDSQKQREEFNKALKEAESKPAEEIAKLKSELQETKDALLCQICFVRRRDCIIFPCSHLLYCRICLAEHKSKGDSRCPICRGPISSEIVCNINHSS